MIMLRDMLFSSLVGVKGLISLEESSTCVSKLQQMFKKALQLFSKYFLVLYDLFCQVVEYSEISKELTEMRDPLSNSRLLFRAGNICNHFFSLDFLERVVR